VGWENRGEDNKREHAVGGEHVEMKLLIGRRVRAPYRIGGPSESFKG